MCYPGLDSTRAVVTWRLGSHPYGEPTTARPPDVPPDGDTHEPDREAGLPARR
jgi:hypothetical protein